MNKIRYARHTDIPDQGNPYDWDFQTETACRGPQNYIQTFTAIV